MDFTAHKRRIHQTFGFQLIIEPGLIIQYELPIQKVQSSCRKYSETKNTT